MISQERVEGIVAWTEEWGDENACEMYHITPETLARYKRLANRQPNRQPKILLFDIETAPNLVYTWGLWDQNISLSQIVAPAYVICWSAKWLFDDEVMSDCITVSEALAEDDEGIMQTIWQLLDECDVCIGHNSDKFDLPWVNGRFLLYGMPPPSPYRSIDTLKAAKRFYLPSRKLDYLGKEFVGYQKIKTDFDLWKGCMMGNKDSLNEMMRYNKKDVQLLEDVYLKFRPWIKSHPNLGLYYASDEERCSNCGSTNLTEMGKMYYTDVNAYKAYRCECGAIVRVRHSGKAAELRGVAR